MGKAALWTAAQDERFALAISAQSGCAGAALWRRRSGETLEKMVARFPYWLCRNAWKFVNQEDDLPVDQHMLLACIAPRPVYVHSGARPSSKATSATTSARAATPSPCTIGTASWTSPITTSRTGPAAPPTQPRPQPKNFRVRNHDPLFTAVYRNCCIVVLRISYKPPAPS